MLTLNKYAYTISGADSHDLQVYLDANIPIMYLCPFCEVSDTSWLRLHCFNITVSVDTINLTFWFVVKPFLFLNQKINVKWPLMGR